MLPYIDILGISLSSYGIFGFLGIFSGISAAVIRSKPEKRADCFYMLLYAIIGALVGAKLLYLITVFPEIVSDFPFIFSNLNGFLVKYILSGFVFYGGLLGGIAGALIYSKEFSEPLLEHFTAAVPSIPLIHAIARIGCFFAGCCYGIPVNPPLGMHFDSYLHDDVYLLPVQLIESAINFCIFIFLLRLTKKNQNGFIALGYYLILYSTARFFLEFFRNDAGRGFIWLLSTSQLISIFTLAAGIIIIFKFKFNKGSK